MSDRGFFLELASRGLIAPLGGDLVLNRQPDPEAAALDGDRLGRLIEEAAGVFGLPLGIPLMDLTREKEQLLAAYGCDRGKSLTFHFTEPPDPPPSEAPLTPLNRANIAAIRYVAARTSLVPMGMLLGPFSLVTKLMPDPITPLALACRGVLPAEEPSIALAERCLELAEKTVLRLAAAQIEAGARAVIVCEPAGNKAYFSPRLLRTGTGTAVFERFVMEPNLRLKNLLDASGVELVFHNCGELTDSMLRSYGERIHPAMLSLGSSRKLWEIAPLIPKDVVLFGNLPSKSFYSDDVMPVEAVTALARELRERMREVGHPFILSSECDVQHVPQAAQTIWNKVEAMLRA